MKNTAKLWRISVHEKDKQLCLDEIERIDKFNLYSIERDMDIPNVGNICNIKFITPIDLYSGDIVEMINISEIYHLTHLQYVKDERY